MRHTQKALASILLMLALMNTACPPKTPEERQTLKHNALAKVDTYANSVKAAQGVVEDLYTYHKISKEQAKEFTEKLKKANALGHRLSEVVKSIDPNATGLPIEVQTILDEMQQTLSDLGVESELARSIADIVAIVNELRGLIR